MSSKTFFLMLCLHVLVNFSVSWSSTINSLLKSKALQHFNQNLNPVIMESVAAGAQMAMDECKSVFKWDRWNCPSSAFSRQAKQLATREKAYVDAILAAGIIYSITRDCSQGVIKGCGCDSTLKKEMQLHNEKTLMEKDWTWGGCSDDASFGENLVLKLLEETEESNDAQAFVSRQNNRIGREIIREKMLKTCKCHGVSGSCSFQTCWMKMPTFQEIARQLKERYDGAILITFERIGNAARQTLDTQKDVLPGGDLLFLEKSPNFCVSDETRGWPGTKGRTCSRTGSSVAEKKSCRNLCRSCGYKVRKQKKRITHRCNCKFIWCCEVECDVCVEWVEEYYCQ